MRSGVRKEVWVLTLVQLINVLGMRTFPYSGCCTWSRANDFIPHAFYGSAGRSTLSSIFFAHYWFDLTNAGVRSHGRASTVPWSQVRQLPGVVLQGIVLH